MVRELQIRSAALDIKAGPEPVGRDGGTLDVPARTPRAKRRFPGGLALAVGAPNERIQRIPLAGTVRVTAALGKEGLHLLARIIRLVAEVLRGLNGSVDVRELRIVDNVGCIGVEKRLHHDRNLVDGLHRSDEVLRRKHGEQLHVRAEKIDLRGAQFAPIHTVALSALEERIIHVGDVLGVIHGVAVIQQLAVNQIKRQIGRCMAQVSGIIRGNATDIHRGGLPLDVELLYLFISGIIEVKRRRGARDGIDVRDRPRLHGHHPNVWSHRRGRMAG